MTLRGCAAIAIGAIVLAVVGIVLAIQFAGGGGSGGDGGRWISAGQADAYPRSDVQYLEGRHIYVTRLANGDFIALYDKSPKQQQPETDCRVRFDDTSTPNTIPQLEGVTGAFVDECAGTRAVYRADGEYAFGSGFGRLDRFRTRVTDSGELQIDVEERTCLRSIGVPGVPPFEERTCRGNG